MRIAALIADLLPAVWFFGCICAYRPGGVLPVEGVGRGARNF